MNQEPYYNGYNKQNTMFVFWPSRGELLVRVDGNSKSFDMRDALFLHGWLGSMIMHYFDEIKAGKSKHSKEMRKIMTAISKSKAIEDKRGDK
jgi:hypothetical protein